MKKFFYVALISCVSLLQAEPPQPVTFEVAVKACDVSPTRACVPVCVDEEMCEFVVCVVPMPEGCAKVCCSMCKDDCVVSECECTIPFGSRRMTQLCDNVMAMISLCKGEGCSVTVCPSTKTPEEFCRTCVQPSSDCPPSCC